MSRPSICLNMIVKDEASFIRNCLKSVKPIISQWLICDTGSTDETKSIVREELCDIPGELHEDEWVGFAHNRNLGLERGKGKAEWQLLMDADMTLNLPCTFQWDSLTSDAYLVSFTGEFDWASIRLVNDRHVWRYRGSVHEYLQSSTATKIEKLQGVTVTHHGDERSGVDRSRKYLELLLQEHKTHPDDPRTIYGIARAFRGIGDPARALYWFERRLRLPGWDEELWHAAFQMAECKDELGRPWPEVLHDLLQAYGLRPSRLEPLLQICRMYRKMKQFHLAHWFSRPALTAAYPSNDLLFIERGIYEYELLLEHAIACCELGCMEEAVELCRKVLAVEDLPEDHRECAQEALQRARRRQAPLSSAA